MIVATQTHNGAQSRMGNDLTGTAQGSYQQTGSVLPEASSLQGNDLIKPATLTHEDEELLGMLDGLWRQHEDRELCTRHKMGALLNHHFGSPEERQQRGQWVLKEASTRLRIGESDLSPMRRFAHHFKDVEDLKKQHPDVNSWTRLKELLPKLKAQGKQDPASGAQENLAATKGASKNPSVRKVERSLHHLTVLVKKNEAELDKETRDNLMAKFKEFAEVVEAKFGIRLKVTQYHKPATAAAA